MVKGPDIIPSLTRKRKQQWFAIQSGMLTSISSRQHSVISGRPLPERTHFGPAVATQHTQLCPREPHFGLHLKMFSSND